MKILVLIFVSFSFVSNGQILKSDNEGVHAILNGDTLVSDTSIHISPWSNDYHINKQGYYYYIPRNGAELKRNGYVIFDRNPHHVGIIDSNLNRITDTIYSGFTFRRSYPFVAGKLFIPRGDTLCLINMKGEELWTTPFKEYSHFNKGVAKIALPESKTENGDVFHPILVVDTIGNIDTLTYESSSLFRIRPPFPYGMRDTPEYIRGDVKHVLRLDKIETVNGKFGVKRSGYNDVYLYPYYDSVRILRISDSVFDHKVICRLNGKRIVVYI